MAGFNVSNVQVGVMGDRKMVFCRITGDGTAYTTGGDTLAPSLFGLGNIDFAQCTTLDTTLANYGSISNVGKETWKLTQIVASSGAAFSGNNTFIYDVMIVGF